MQAWFMRMTPAGGELERRERPPPVPGPGQMLVQLHAASLNRGEFVVEGQFEKTADWKPAGGEGAGVVRALGEGVQGFAVGDAVMGRCSGAFAEYALMEDAESMHKPEPLSWEEASALPLTFLVAFDMLVLQGRLRPGEWMLVAGVSSGVGVACLQLAKALGAKVLGTSGSADKLHRLAALGLDVGLHTRTGDFAASVREATGGHGADLVIDTVGGSVFPECLRAMAFEGRLAMVGYVDGVLKAELDLGLLHRQRLVLFGVSNKLRSKAQRAAALPRFRAEVLPLVADGRIRPQIERVFGFDELSQAKALMEAGGHLGKIVLRM